MRTPVALGMLALISPWWFGCAPGAATAKGPPFVWVNAAENQAPTNHYARSSSGPYSVTTRTDGGPVFSQILNTQAVVTIGERKITIEFDQARILFDDGTEVKLPAGTKEVEIKWAAGKLSITADGADVPRPQPVSR